MPDVDSSHPPDWKISGEGWVSVVAIAFVGGYLPFRLIELLVRWLIGV